jgi:hypothetical protein
MARCCFNRATATWGQILCSNRALSYLISFNDLLELLGPIHLVVLLENSGLEILIMLGHHCGFFEVSFEFLKTLNAPIGNLTSFFGIKSGPFPSMEFPEKVQDEIVVHKVHKSVPYICLVLVIYRHIEEIVLALEFLIDFLQEKPLIILVGNVLDHNCGSSVFAAFDLFDVNSVELVSLAATPARLRRLRVGIDPTGV